ncbi:transcriptional regulator [Desulfarculus baarsii DSM 2075]|uniref:Transcriptional regulator n=1 Tax=Desulfarculus baarsii (strain ATCC 33931 / DSM 2075 / LMG 7858 / VKM B-1802 / 2st14) TaxID=644282 RepID=E1QKG2_DESB2|nr:transcriptional regulator [Desulfarculus baarsii]ADK86055.1 transcriptional regulator [Desulfarculus baarsii DSM 2075]
MEKTIRQAIVEALEGRPHSARQLAEALLLRPAEVEEHLEHIGRSMGGRLRLTPARCLACGYRFTERKRLSAPGRCPRCRGQKIAGPWFQVDGRASQRRV